MRRIALLLALLVLSASLAPPAAAAGAAPAAPAPATTDGVAPAVTAPGDPPHQRRLSTPANTTIEIRVRGNRSARWTVTVTYTLDSANETTAFRRYADAYRNDETDTGLTVAPFRRIVDAASQATDRRMVLRNVSRTATVRNETATLGLSFVWTGMLERTGNRTIRLDDAVLTAESRTWLGTLEPNQTLVVHTPEGYSIVDSEAPSFDLRNNSVVIAGPAQIDGNLDITYRKTVPLDTDPDTGLSTEVVLATALLGAALVALAVFLRRRERAPSAARTGSDAGDASAAAAGEEGETGDGDATETGGEERGGEETGEEATAEGVDPTLLSDEERVEHLIRRNGGRMKQATIVDETGWSDAKVSQLLSSMAAEDRVNKLRLGRENLISLPEDENEDGETG